MWSAIGIVAFPISEGGSVQTFHRRDAPEGTKIACGLSCFFGCIACCAECVAYALCLCSMLILSREGDFPGQ